MVDQRGLRIIAWGRTLGSSEKLPSVAWRYLLVTYRKGKREGPVRHLNNQEGLSEAMQGKRKKRSSWPSARRSMNGKGGPSGCGSAS